MKDVKTEGWGRWRSLVLAFLLSWVGAAAVASADSLDNLNDCRNQVPVLSLYPSPAHSGGRLHVKFQWCESDKATLVVYNVSLFQAVRRQDITTAGINTWDIPLDGFAAGVYYVFLEIDTGTSKQQSGLVKFAVLR